MNYIPNAANLPKGMAHYWFELADDGGDSKNYFLFCQTSDQQIFHATKPQLMEFISSSGNKNRLLLKPWNLIGVNGQKRTRKGKAKGEEEEEEEEEEEKEEEKELPKKKKQKAIVLPAPSLSPVLPALMRELPFELLDMILDGMAEPTLSVRRFIFDALKGSKVNRVVFHLINSRTIWKWYLEILGHNPPLGLAQLEIYYKNRGEFNKFARRWYDGFVRRYDVGYLSRLWEYYKVYGFNKMKKRMNSTTMYVLMMHLRGKTIGSEEDKNKNVTDYEKLEIAIQQQMDKVEPHYPVAGFMTRPLQVAMIGEIAKWNTDVNTTLLRHMHWGRSGKHGGRNWYVNTYLNSRTHYMVGHFVRQTLQLCEDAIRTIRGLGPEQIFTARDLTAYVWLNQVITRLLWHPLKKAMQPELFLHSFIVDIREEVRLDARSKEQKDIEDKLSIEERESAWRIKQGEYSARQREVKDAWAKHWGPKKEKEKEKVKAEDFDSTDSWSSADEETIDTHFWN